MIQEKRNEILKQIEEACKKSQRSPKEITLVAVSKTQNSPRLLEAFQCGQRHFGENYVQEWEAKSKDLQKQTICWHFIGRLQKNKCKKIVGKVEWIHTIDSLELAEEIEKRIPDGSQQKALLQFNVSQEDSKSGFRNKTDLREVLQKPWKKLSLQGLMCIPSFALSPEEARPFFRDTRILRDQLEQELSLPLPHLSMGMSSDFPIAIEEGATMIRIGTSLFGERP